MMRPNATSPTACSHRSTTTPRWRCRHAASGSECPRGNRPHARCSRAKSDESESDTKDFVHRRVAEQRLGETVLEHRRHAVGERGLAQRGGAGALHDAVAGLGVDLVELEDADPAPEPRAVALLAALALEESNAGPRIGAGAEGAPLPEH